MITVISFYSFLDVFVKDRAQFSAVADTAFIGMLLPFLNPHFGLGNFSIQLMFKMRIDLPEGLSE